MVTRHLPSFAVPLELKGPKGPSGPAMELSEDADRPHISPRETDSTGLPVRAGDYRYLGDFPSPEAGPVPRLTAVSLFSGALGLDLGFELASYDIRFACDNLPAAVETIRANRPNLPVYDGDIRSLSGEEILRLAGLRKSELDVVIGGPPCQSFSTAGLRRGLDDADRGTLVFEYARILKELRPRAFVMENVKGLLSSPKHYMKMPRENNGRWIPGVHGILLKELLAEISGLGYSIQHRLLNSADFGVPQVRNRVFFIGFLDGREASFPQPTHSQHGRGGLPRWVTVGSVLRNLRGDDSFRNSFSQRKLKYLRLVPEGGNWRSLPRHLQKESMGRAFYAKGGRTGWWRRLSFDELAPTLLSEPQNSGTALCHPRENRPLTVREYARIQTFPDDWELRGKGMDQYRMLGNAVPVRLSMHVARRVRDDFARRRKRVRVACRHTEPIASPLLKP